MIQKEHPESAYDLKLKSKKLTNWSDVKTSVTSYNDDKARGRSTENKDDTEMKGKTAYASTEYGNQL